MVIDYIMKPWQESLNKAPSKGGAKEGTKREKTQVGARRAKSKLGHSGTYEQTDYLTSCCTTSSP
jgi:hypothetical protein